MLSVKNTTQKKQILPRNDHLCQIEMVDKFKFLGIYIDPYLKFSHHCQHITSKANARIYILLKLKRMGVQTDKLKLFYITNVCSTSFLYFLTKQQVY